MDKMKETNSKLYIKKIKFSDGNELELEEDSIVVITGPNNVGKSQSLKDIEALFKNKNAKTRVVTQIENQQNGNIFDEKVIEDKFTRESNGQYRSTNSYVFNSYEDISRIVDTDRNLYNSLRTLFIKRASTESRLMDSNPIDRRSRHEENPIYRVYKNEKIESIISGYFRKAFNCDLVINRNDFMYVQFHVGEAPDKNNYTIAQHNDYYGRVDCMPLLSE